MEKEKKWLSALPRGERAREIEVVVDV